MVSAFLVRIDRAGELNASNIKKKPPRNTFRSGLAGHTVATLFG